MSRMHCMHGRRLLCIVVLVQATPPVDLHSCWCGGLALYMFRRSLLVSVYPFPWLYSAPRSVRPSGIRASPVWSVWFDRSMMRLRWSAGQTLQCSAKVLMRLIIVPYRQPSRRRFVARGCQSGALYAPRRR